MSSKRLTTVSGIGQATEPLHVGRDGVILMAGEDNGFDGEITVQFSSYDFGTWIDDIKITEPVVYKIKQGNEIFIRVVCTSYTSGSIKVVMYREQAPSEVAP